MNGLDDPVIITNAHVIQNSRKVEVQLPILGQTYFEAFVPLVCFDFDLAVVRIKESDKFTKALENRGIKLAALPLVQERIEMGAEAIAFGFPLGTHSPKISRGVIGGAENIKGIWSTKAVLQLALGILVDHSSQQTSA